MSYEKEMRLADLMERHRMLWRCDECGYRHPMHYVGYFDNQYNKQFCNKSCCEKNIKKRKEK